MLTPISEATLDHWTFAGSDDVLDVRLSDYKGVDFSKQAFLFCGQGAMKAGTSGEGLEGHAVFQNRFRELDELALKAGIGRPSEFLSQPEKIRSKAEESVFSGLCLYAIQVAMFETLLAAGYLPRAMTAHSFGEFAQLTAAGVVRFDAMVEFLIQRQKRLAEFQDPFAMFAVSHSGPVAIDQLPKTVFPANFNTEYQTVFVCRDEDFADVKSALKTMRLACVRMSIDYPYHTPWLESVRKKLAQDAITQHIELKPPKIPFVSSVTHQLINKSNFNEVSVRKSLTDQLVTPVRFAAQLDQLYQRGIANFFELSPVDVLDAFVEQYFEKAKSPFKINSFRKAFKTSSTANKSYERLRESTFFGKLDSALKALTGYSIQQIRLEDRIREDLGIDSIKKAEIVFEIIDSMSGDGAVTPTNLADLATFGDILEYFETTQLAAGQPKVESEKETIAHFEPRVRGWSEQKLTDFTASVPPKIRWIDFANLLAHPAELRTSASELLVFSAQGLQSGDYLSNASQWLKLFKTCQWDGLGLILIHDGTPAGSGLDALLTSLAQERQITYKSIEWTEPEKPSDDLLARERADFFHTRVRYAHGVRFIRSFEPLRKTAQRPIRNVLAFGGLGGVGYAQLMSFAEGSLDRLVIVGRRPLDEESGPKIAPLEKVAKNVVVRQADVSVPGVALRTIHELQNEFGFFDLVLHSVGVEISESLDKISDSEIQRILGAKIHLAEALSRAEVGEARIVLNSSIVSEYGSRGQCAYAVANAYLNSLADQSDRVLSLLWPGWENVGVAGQAINQKSLKLQGLTLMSTANGQDVFQMALQQNSGTVGVLGSAASLDFSAIGQGRSEFAWFMKPASRDYSLFVVPGLTQQKLPYLRDHLVKRACIFPASGSMSMMLFRAYIERGELGHIRNFMAHNFLVVREDSSNVTLETLEKTSAVMKFQVKSHQLLAMGEVSFVNPEPAPIHFSFHADQRGVTDYDQNVAVYTGPKFELAKESFIDRRTNTLLLDVDLEKAPVFFPIPILDKLHRLIELCFNTSHSKALLDFDKFTVPKSIEAIDFFKEELAGHHFYTVIENLRPEGALFLCDILTLNEKGQIAIRVKNLRSIVVGDSKTATTKGYRLSDCDKTFFA